MHFRDPPIAMTLTYINLDILLSDLWKVLTVAHYLLKNYKQKKFEKYSSYSERLTR